MSDKYVLRGHEVVPVEDLITWAIEFENGPHSVKHDQVGDYEVSTIFLGVDMNLMRSLNQALPPLLFETMVFSGFNRAGKILAQERCSTWDQAVEQHDAMVARFRRQAAG